MDNRTREKYRAQVRVMLHLLEGHRSRLPAGKPLSTALADGMAAAQALGFDLLTREARAMAGRTTAVGRGVEALFCGKEPLGMERGLPRGDV